MRVQFRTLLLRISATTLIGGCAVEPPMNAGPAMESSPGDGGARRDGGFVDLSTDASTAPDAGPLDAGPLDAGPLDAGPLNAGPLDAGPLDAGPLDAGPPPAPCRPWSGDPNEVLDVSCCTANTIPGCAGGVRTTVVLTCTQIDRNACGSGSSLAPPTPVYDPATAAATPITFDEYPALVTLNDARRLGYRCLNGGLSGASHAFVHSNAACAIVNASPRVASSGFSDGVSSRGSFPNEIARYSYSAAKGGAATYQTWWSDSAFCRVTGQSYRSAGTDCR